MAFACGRHLRPSAIGKAFRSRHLRCHQVVGPCAIVSRHQHQVRRSVPYVFEQLCAQGSIRRLFVWVNIGCLPFKNFREQARQVGVHAASQQGCLRFGEGLQKRFQKALEENYISKSIKTG